MRSWQDLMRPYQLMAWKAHQRGRVAARIGGSWFYRPIREERGNDIFPFPLSKKSRQDFLRPSSSTRVGARTEELVSCSSVRK